MTLTYDRAMVNTEDDDVPFHCILLNGIDSNNGRIIGHDPAGQIKKISLKDEEGLCT